MNQIWKRYFLIELTKVFILFICSFYFLYVLIDYSVHTKAFQSTQVSFFNIVLYYIYQFTKRADILVPITLMIATIKVLTASNLCNEIVALVTGGVSLKKVLSPFLGAAFFCLSLLFLNFQFLLPIALCKITAFEERYFKNKVEETENKQVNALVLEDNTLLIYHSYDQEKKAFFDVFWLKNCDQLWRIQSLFPYEKIPIGKYVDFLSRTPEGEIVKVASYDEIAFPEIEFCSQALFNAVHPPRMQSISQLARHVGWKQAKFGMGKMNDREAEAATHFYFKLMIPFACLLAVLGPAPYCLRFSRHLPIFLIYALSLFGLITFFTFMNALVILGVGQVIPPLLVILIPQTIFFLILGWKYAKL